MTAKELQRMIEGARVPYTPGKRMDQYQDQDILVGIVDGLGGDWRRWYSRSCKGSTPKRAGSQTLTHRPNHHIHRPARVVKTRAVPVEVEC